jgi:hypothetical protein
MRRAPQFAESLLDRQQAFGYTQEDLKFLMSPMAQAGEEGIGSMGNDSPLAVLSDKNKPLLQLLQAALRAGDQPADRPDPRAIVMSLVSVHRPEAEPARHQRGEPADAPGGAAARSSTSRTWRGCAHRAAHARQVQELRAQHHLPAGWGDEGIEAKLASLCAETVDAIKTGHNILIISDRQMDRDHIAIPALLALSAVHQHLVREGPAHDRGPGRRDRLGARGAPLRRARGLRRRGGASVPRARVAW